MANPSIRPSCCRRAELSRSQLKVELLTPEFRTLPLQ